MNKAPVSLADEVQRWTDEQLQCRTLQHAWKPQSATYSKRYRYYATTYGCMRCGTLKHQELDSSGYIVASWYTYSEGYLSGAGFLSADARAQIRVASLSTRVKNVATGTKPKNRDLASVTPIKTAKAAK